MNPTGSNSTEKLFLVPDLTLQLGSMAGKSEAEIIIRVSDATKEIFSSLDKFSDAESYAAAINAAAFYGERVVSRSVFENDAQTTHKFYTTIKTMRRRSGDQ